MKLKIPLLFVFLLFIVHPCLAAVHLNASDFADPHPVVEPKKDYYREGDEISLNYTIAPKTDADATDVDGRYYDLHTSLNYPTFTVVIAYRNGGILYPSIKPWEKDVSIEVGDWEDGLDNIKVELSGKIPAPQTRLEEVSILWINVSDADYDVLPPVKVKVIDFNKFTDDINSLKSRLKELEDRSKNLDEMGADVVDADKILKSASEDLDDAESYYKDANYLKADEKLKDVEEELNDAEKELNKAEAEYLYDTAQEKLNEVQLLIVQFEYLLQQAKSENIIVTLYEFNLTKAKSDYNIQLDRVEKVNDYIEEEEYDKAKEKANDVINATADIKTYLEDNIAKIKELVAAQTTTPTPSPSPSPTQFPFDFSFITKNVYLILKVVAAIVLIAIAAFGVYKGIGRYRRRRKWDELK
ncbi:hypothetical protein DRP05_04385 [Archaeoglobales archaeon]|nr:MAG: hypothetical protein DRP05_04385 [Archaeoglobales archaeon]